MSNVVRANRFTLQAMMNGMTLQAKIVVDRGALSVAMDKDTFICNPDWGSNGAVQPMFHAEVRDTANPSVVKPVLSPKLIWQGVEVKFGESSTATQETEWNATDTTQRFSIGTFAGMFARQIDSNGVTNYTILQSPFDANNQDNDSFRIEGKIELTGGSYQDFSTADESVRVYLVQSGTVAYEVNIQAWDFGTGEANAGKVIAYLHQVGSTIKIQNGVTVKFYNMNGSSLTEIVTTPNQYAISASQGEYTLQILDADLIDGDDVILARFTYGGKTYDGTANISDLSDPFFVTYEIGGNVSNGYLLPGNNSQAEITMRVVTESDPTSDYELTGKQINVTVVNYQGTVLNGNAYTFQRDAKNPCKGTLTMTYSQLTSADVGGMISGYISIDPTNT